MVGSFYACLNTAVMCAITFEGGHIQFQLVHTIAPSHHDYDLALIFIDKSQDSKTASNS